MAKELKAIVKVVFDGGQATAGPPIGPALGQHGVNMGQVISELNKVSTPYAGITCRGEIRIYKDRSFEIPKICPTVSGLLKKAANVAKGSGVPNKDKVGSLTIEQAKEIVQAKKKFGDFNASSDEAALQMVLGTARSMGIEVKGAGQ